MSKTNKHNRKKRRYRPGRRTFRLDPTDAGVIFKGSTGQVKFMNGLTTDKEMTVGGPSFWMNLLHWLFAASPEAKDRRDALVQEFVTDMEERQIRSDAEQRVAAALDDPEIGTISAEEMKIRVDKEIEIMKHEAADLAEMEKENAEEDHEPENGNQC